MNDTTETAAQKKAREKVEQAALKQAAADKDAAAKAEADRKAAEKAAVEKAKAEAKAQKDAEAKAKKEAAEALKAEQKAKKEQEAAEKKAAAEQAKAAAKAALEAKRVEKERAKEQAKIDAAELKARNTRNGITRPREDGKCGQAWALFDSISKVKGSPAAMAEIKPEAEKLGLNPANVSAEYSRWKKFYGLPAGRIAPAGTAGAGA